MLNCAMAITWTLLSPVYGTNIDLQDLEAAMLISYALYISGLVIYSYLRIRQAKLHNFYMSKVLLDQAYGIFFHGLDQPAAERQVAALCRRLREDRGAHPVTDQALDEAKHNGKDRFVLWTAEQSKPTHPQADKS
jgi:hypothetical protein